MSDRWPEGTYVMLSQKGIQYIRLYLGYSYVAKYEGIRQVIKKDGTLRIERDGGNSLPPYKSLWDAVLPDDVWEE